MRYTSIQKKKISKIFSIYPEEIEFIPADDPFRFLCTVILSASSTDEMALRSADKLFSSHPTAKDIAGLEEEEIASYIRSSGLTKSKARSIKALSRKASEEGIPETLEELTRLPGIGEKTASCYLVSILKKPAVIVDTHFARVASRLGLVKATTRDAIYKEVKESYPEEIWARLSMTVNKHGRTYCFARKPDCNGCPLGELCPSWKKFKSVE